MVWYDESPLGFVPQSKGYRQSSGWGSPYGNPYAYSGYEVDPWMQQQRRRQRQEHERLAREQELRRRQSEIEQYRKRQAAAAKHKERQRVLTKLRQIRASMAARVIQRWWRPLAQARRNAAAAIVIRALQRNVAVAQARRVVESLRRLLKLEASIEAVPSVTLAEAEGSDKASTKARLVFEHTLEKLVLSADNIPTMGSETARAIRKKLVLRANARLAEYDEMTEMAQTPVTDITSSDNDEVTTMELTKDEKFHSTDTFGDGSTANMDIDEPCQDGQGPAMVQDTTDTTGSEDFHDAEVSEVDEQAECTTPGIPALNTAMAAVLRQKCQLFATEISGMRESAPADLQYAISELLEAVSSTEHRLDELEIAVEQH